MATTAKTIMEELARSKGYYHRHEIMRAMISLATALKGLVESNVAGPTATQISGMVREQVQRLNRTEEVQGYAPDGLVFQRGGEKKLLLQLARIIKQAKEDAEKESEEAMAERKLQMDRLLLRGQKLLDVGKVADAEEAFQEAVGLYVDEHVLFCMIGQKLLDADQPKLALKYLQQGLEKDPDLEMAWRGAAEALIKLGEPDRAAGLLAKAQKRLGDGAERMVLLARAFDQKQEPGKALAAVKKALQIEPGLMRAKKLLPKLKKKAAA